MGNSYSTNFFSQICPYLKNFKCVNKLILNDCFTRRKQGICDSLELITEALHEKGVFA